MQRALALLVLAAGCDRFFNISTQPLPDAALPTEPGWAALAAGYSHTCGVRNSGDLYCWGENQFGDANGHTDVAELLAPVRIDGGPWTAVTAGYNHTCALTRGDRSLWCWGYGVHGELGNGTQVTAPPSRIGNDAWVDISAAGDHTCGIKSDQTVWCWGLNTSGELGDGTVTAHDVPTRVATSERFTQVRAGDAHTCAITTGSALWCWGLDTSGQLGDGENQPMALHPVLVPDTWRAVAAGRYHSCGITTAGKLMCWGDNALDRLGDGTTQPSKVPTAVATDRTDWTAIDANADRTCATADDHTVLCWGSSIHGELADAPAASAPRVIAGATRAVVGGFHACFVDAAGALSCVGSNARGQLGDGTGGSRLAPVQVEGMWKSVGLGTNTSCGVHDDGSVACWGWNEFQQLGDGTGFDADAPVATTVIGTSVSAGRLHTCALDTSRHVQCWGSNAFGEQAVGLGTVNVRPTPVVIPVPSANNNLLVAAVSANGDHVCALSTNATIYCWGRGDNGQLGRGGVPPTDTTPNAVLTPQMVANAYLAVAAGVAHTCGIGTGKAVHCWGANDAGQLGLNSIAGMHSYDEATSDTSAAAIAAGRTHTCALDPTGLLSCWGDNSNGQFGDGTTDSSPMPKVIGAIPWTAIALGDLHTCGIQRSDNTLWCWGNNYRGTLGDGTRTTRRLPVPIGTEAWIAIAANSQHTCGVRMDHTLWCWGDAFLGQIGDGHTWIRQPVRVPDPD